jgi:hypothetical protein
MLQSSSCFQIRLCGITFRAKQTLPDTSQSSVVDLPQVVVDGITLRVGDAAYVVLDPKKYRAFVSISQ